MRNVFYGGQLGNMGSTDHDDMQKKAFRSNTETGLTGSPTTDGGSFRHSRYLKEAEHDDSSVQIQMPQKASAPLREGQLKFDSYMNQA